MNKTLLVIVLTVVIVGPGACGEAPPQAAADAVPLARLLGAAEGAGFDVAAAAREFSFPADHGPHPGFRNEWWYLTGNLDDADGRRYGYELTLFRFLLAPADAPRAASRWAANSVIVGHFAITDAAAGRYRWRERYARGAAGLGGASADPLRVWLYDWSVRRRPERPGADASWQLQATSDDMGLALTLQALRAPVLHGDRGLSQKSAAAGNASYYYSVPRLATSGRLTLDGRSVEVSGLSWLDREWSSSALGAGQQGWDWFSLQLEDGSDLMFYQLRRTDGSRDPHSAGTFMPAGAAPRALAAGDVELEVLDHWDSPAGGRYPGEWRLVVPQALVNLRIRPVLADQELAGRVVRYWEGAVDVSGTHGATRVSGRGYVELTGYATAGDAR